MILRPLAVLLLVITGLFATLPGSNYSTPMFITHSVHAPSFHPNIDPNVTLTAFNYTLAEADLFTYPMAQLVPSSPPTGSTFTPFNTFSHTKDSSPVPGGAFNFSVASGSNAGTQSIRWNFTIPKSNCAGCNINGTVVGFSYRGILNTATSSNYTLTFVNGTRNQVIASKLENANFTSSGTSFPGCPPKSVCIEANKYVGYNATLTFKFDWGTSTKGMVVSVGEVLVGATANIPTSSTANWMSMNTTDNTKVNHTAKLSVALVNSTVQYPNPLKSNQLLNHTWSNQVINIYYPSGYNLTKETINNTNTQFIPTYSLVPFQSQTCSNIGTCTQSLLALNMSDYKPTSALLLRNTVFNLFMISRNTLHPTATSKTVTTSFGNVTIPYFQPGDNITVKVVNNPSAANLTIAQANPVLTINFTAPNGNTTALLGQPFFTTKGGLFGFTLPPGPFGLWNSTVFYESQYDLGASSTTFRLDQLVMNPQTVNPNVSGNSLVFSSKILDSAGNPVAGATGTVFAADASSNAIPVTVSNSSTSGGLYISNVTMVNGVFTSGQSLTLFFTVTNPTKTIAYSANLTINHEWLSGQLHAANVTIPLKLGDEPFTLGAALYKLELNFAQNGIQTRVTSMQTQRSTQLLTMRNNSSSPVIPSRQQTGLFKLALASTNGTGLHINTIETPPFAYVLAGPETTSGYLAHSPSFTTGADGSFTSTVPANETIGAGKLVLFALARDSIRGLTLWGGQDPTSATDNTRLVTSADRIGELTVGQSATATLHVQNNSTRLPQTITIDLYLGNNKMDSKTVSLQPHSQASILQYSFKAPNSPGSYTLTYSSPQYRGPLASQTIQVVLIPGLVQLLIPLIIGVIAAIAILGYYLFRNRRITRTTTTTATTTKTTTTKTP